VWFAQGREPLIAAVRQQEAQSQSPEVPTRVGASLNDGGGLPSASCGMVSLGGYEPLNWFVWHMRRILMATVCTKCGASIQDATAERNNGRCQPCSERRLVRKRVEGVDVMPQGPSIDWQCIGIEKQSETAEVAVYRFVASVWEADPEKVGRSRITGEAAGQLRLIKATGEVVLEESMPGDTHDRRFHSAAHALRRHWKQNQYPDRTMFACG